MHVQRGILGGSYQRKTPFKYWHEPTWYTWGLRFLSYYFFRATTFNMQEAIFGFLRLFFESCNYDFWPRVSSRPHGIILQLKNRSNQDSLLSSNLAGFDCHPSSDLVLKHKRKWSQKWLFNWRFGARAALAPFFHFSFGLLPTKVVHVEKRGEWCWYATC